MFTNHGCLDIQKASSESIELNDWLCICEVWKCLWNWWKEIGVYVSQSQVSLSCHNFWQKKKKLWVVTPKIKVCVVRISFRPFDIKVFINIIFFHLWTCVIDHLACVVSDRQERTYICDFYLCKAWWEFNSSFIDFLWNFVSRLHPI